MIERLFRNPNPPTVLTDGLLKKGEQIYIPVSKIYIFVNTRRVKVEEVGSDWIANHIPLERKIQGYFHTYQSQNSLGLFDFEESNIEITIIGNKENTQYQLFGVSLQRTNNFFGENGNGQFSVSKFSALSLDIIHIPKE
jgi:hypothetical protein